MLKMFVDIGLYGLGLALLVYLIYSLFLSKGASQPDKPVAKPRRFERREGERGDRRKQDQGPPDGVERRTDGRRSRDSRD